MIDDVCLKESFRDANWIMIHASSTSSSALRGISLISLILSERIFVTHFLTASYKTSAYHAFALLLLVVLTSRKLLFCPKLPSLAPPGQDHRRRKSHRKARLQKKYITIHTNVATDITFCWTYCTIHPNTTLQHCDPNGYMYPSRMLVPSDSAS